MLSEVSFPSELLDYYRPLHGRMVRIPKLKCASMRIGVTKGPSLRDWSASKDQCRDAMRCGSSVLPAHSTANTNCDGLRAERILAIVPCNRYSDTAYWLSTRSGCWSCRLRCSCWLGHWWCHCWSCLRWWCHRGRRNGRSRGNTTFSTSTQCDTERNQ
jgi:hypothetical protein